MPKYPLALCSRAGHRANKLPFTHGAGASPKHAQMIITSLGCGAWTRAPRLEGEFVNGEILIYAKTTSLSWLASEVGGELPPPKDDPEASGRARPRAQIPLTWATGGCAPPPLWPAACLWLRETARPAGGLFEILIDQNRLFVIGCLRQSPALLLREGRIRRAVLPADGYLLFV